MDTNDLDHHIEHHHDHHHLDHPVDVPHLTLSHGLNPGLGSSAPIDHHWLGPGKDWARLTARRESRWLLYGNFGFNIQFRSRVSESEKCVITSIRSAEPSCGFLQVQSFCIGSGCNCTDHLRLLPSIAKCKM